jgi:hypothetical protein
MSFFVELLGPLPAFIIGLYDGLYVLGVNAESPLQKLFHRGFVYPDAVFEPE